MTTPETLAPGMICLANHAGVAALWNEANPENPIVPEPAPES